MGLGRMSVIRLVAVSAAVAVAAPALGTDDLSLNVDSGTECVSTGQTITVTLDVANLSAAINGVQVRLNYDNTLMTLVDIAPTNLFGGTPPGWIEISETDTAGDVDWAAVIQGGQVLFPHTVATLTFTAIADGTASVTFRADSPPFYTKLTRASDSSSIYVNGPHCNGGDRAGEECCPGGACSTGTCSGGSRDTLECCPNSGTCDARTTYDTGDDFDGDSVGDAFIGPPDCTITADSDVCDGTSGHVASVPDAGGGATYAWTVTGGTIDSGQGTTSISYTAGSGPNVTVDVTVTDGNGCDSSCQTVVPVNANPDCTITAADSICANSTANPASVPNAGGGATYVWSVTGGTLDSGQGTTSISFSAASGPSVTLDVTTTDSNGCVSTCQKVISVAAPDCTITAADEVCDGSTGNVASVPDAGGGATYTWTVTGGTITGGQGTTAMTYTAVSGTSVTVDVTVVGGAGCQSSCQKVVTVNANPDCTITGPSAVCASTGGHAASVPVAGVSPTYVWTVTGGTLDSGQGTTSLSYTAGSGPTLTIDVTVTDDNGCVSSCQQVVTVNANPDCTITADAAVCDGSSGNAASVPIAAGGAYVWTVTGGTIDSGQGSTSISYTAGSGPNVTIDITVTDGNGCISSCQTIVSVNANPDCTITAADAVCDGSSGNTASVPVAAGGAYVWTVTGGTIDSGQGSTSISYTAGSGPTLTIDITVTDGNGCVSTCQKVVNVASNPTCIITADDAVCDASTGNAASTADVGGGASYAWTVTGGTLNGGQNTPNITYTAGSGPTITIDLTVTDAGACVSTCQKVVTVNANPDCTITADAAVCASTSSHVASVPIAGGGTYVWTVTGGTIDSGQGTDSISYTAGSGPTLTIDITVTDGNGCVSSCQQVVTVNTNPDATITADSAVCDGSGSNAASVADAGGGASYLWAVTGGTLDTGQGTTSIGYTAGSGPTLTIDVTVTDGNGCVSSSQTVVTVNANPDATITADSAVCDGSTGNAASVADAGGGATYAWTVTGGTLDSGQGTTSINYTAGSGPTLTVDVTVTNGNGCVSSSQSVVTVNSNPTCIITAPAVACAGTSGHNAFVSDAGGGATYVWSVSGGTLDSGQGTTSISFSAGSGAAVTLDVTVTDANGCVSSCQEVVTVNPNPDCTISANDLVCAGFSGNGASVPGAGAGASYTWTVTGGTLNSGQGTNSISFTAGLGTSLTLEVTVTDANGCVSTCQKIVTVDAPDCTISGANSVCYQSVGNFATVPPAGGGATYFWTVTGGTLTTGQGTNSITYSAGSGTMVTLDVTVTNSNGCDSNCQKLVTIIQPSLDVMLELEAVSEIVTRDVTFVITECGVGTDVRVLPVTTDFDWPAQPGVGSITVAGTNPNADWVTVQEGHTLRRLVPVTYGACSVATVDLTGVNQLLGGDFHTATVVPQDNLCDITDFSILASAWNQAISADETTGGDATGDGWQDMADFTIIQNNFFAVGEADDACAALLEGDGFAEQIAEVEPYSPVETWNVPRSSIAVDRLTIPGAHKADMTGDGVVDARDIRAFARAHGLALRPEFSRKLEKLESLKRRSNRERE